MHNDVTALAWNGRRGRGDRVHFSFRQGEKVKPDDRRDTGPSVGGPGDGIGQFRKQGRDFLANWETGERAASTMNKSGAQFELLVDGKPRLGAL